MEKKNFKILSTNSRDMDRLRLFQASQAKALAGQKIEIFQKSSKFNIVSMEKKNFEILSTKSWDMDRLRLLQASQGRSGMRKILRKKSKFSVSP